MFLQIQGIKKSFGAGDSRVDVLKGLDLDIERGEFCVLLGPSGSGKSTLLNIIGGIDSADEGNLVIDGERLADMSEKKLSLYRRKHLGYIFQMYNLIPNLTVRENIEVGAYLSDKPLDVDELLHTLGIYEHQRKLPNQLSGGQQQRTAIGRAIVKNPDILLCDEPTGALDYKTSKEILKLIETVNQKYGNTIVMVTHNDAIKDMADRVVKLRDGMIRKNYLNEHKIPQQSWTGKRHMNSPKGNGITDETAYASDLYPQTSCPKNMKGELALYSKIYSVTVFKLPAIQQTFIYG